MNSEMSGARRAILLAASAGSWASASAQVREPEVLAPVTTLGKSDAAKTGALGNMALQREVALEAVREPIAKAVAELAAQGLVTLKIDPAQEARLPKECRVTMRVRALPLARVLASLAELYGGQWQKGEGQSFVWLPLETPLALEARRLGGLAVDSKLSEYEAKRQRNADLARQVFDSVDEARWRSPEGVALSDITPDLQALLIRQRQSSEAVDVARAYTFFGRVLESEPYLRLGRVAPDTPRLWTARMFDASRGDFGLRLMVAGNRYVAPLFDAPTSSAPGAAQPDDTDADGEAMRRAADEKAAKLRDRIRNPNR